MIEYAKVLKFQGKNFYFTGEEEGREGPERVYKMLDELHQWEIRTAAHDYDGVLIGVIDEALSDDPDDDFLRYFDCVTGEEEE